MKSSTTGLAFALAVMWSSSACAADPTDVLGPLRGRVTYVDFWASWCAPCAQSFPWLNQMKARYESRGLRIVGVGLDADTRKGDRFLAVHPATFATLQDPEGKLAEHFGVEGMPYAVLIDQQGRVIHRHTGFRDDSADDYERTIREALGPAGGTP